ncbi:MAG: tRNA (N(6)-L-threonylcarbamoyladenosine(37)-C(2))-methylthiotransferase MtaB, partial [Oscillospiraceae bacterium]|nr:tRNA (N(6)-L-threonylcarbamoyladenosine(37)-C(2))-methylthiotransferase MtaB [Oscillospiraceae bacterium]
ASETFVRNIAFARCHIFVYSPRPGTPAAALEGRIPPGEAKRRASQMAKAANELELAFLESQRGSVQPVLFEQMAGGLWQGHTGSYILVKVKSEEDLRGKILPVMIEQAGRGCCLGRLA